MTLKYYHAEPLANSLKSMVPLIEKGLPWQSIYVDLHKFEQHEPWFLKINPEGQVPVLDHDGVILNHSSIINEYLEDVFPDVPLRPRNPVDAARMRYWNKFLDEHFLNYVSIHGWHRMIGAIARAVEGEEFERLMERIPLPDQRKKWRAARAGFRQADLDYATEKVTFAIDKAERQLGETPWIAGDDYTLADINLFASGTINLELSFPQLFTGERCPRLLAWRERMNARPAVALAVAGGKRTAART
jgi:glutathione S-transferase